MNNLKGMILSILILTLAMTMISCVAKDESEVEVEIVPVTVVNPEYGDIVVFHGTSSTVEADDFRSATFSVGGKVKALYKQEGERIFKGEILAELDREAYRNGLQAADSNLSLALKGQSAADIELEMYENQYEMSLISYEQDKLEFERYQRLYEENAITDRELERVQTAYKNARIALENAEKMVKLSKGKVSTMIDTVQAADAQVNIARQQYQDSILLSPFDGTIFKKYITVDSVVAPGMPVYEIIAEGKNKIDASLPERYLKNVRDGSTVLVTIPNNECEMKPQKIARVHSEISPGTGSFGVTIILDDVNGCIRHGMFAQLHFEVERAENVMTIPIEAVLELHGERTVYVVRNDKAMRVTIKQGLESKDRIEVVEGLNPDDAVILSGNRYVVDETLVRVIAK